MPAFTFEKISPPVPRPAPQVARNDAAPDLERKPRGLIVQVIDRLAEARTQRRTKGVIARNANALKAPKPD